MRDILSILIIIFLWTSCSTTDTGEPTRIKGIPENTFWVGGQDGGQWFEIKEIDKESLTADIAIYNENTGDLDADRQFKLKCNSKSQFNLDNLKNEINGFDGQRILLKQLDKEDRNCFLE